MNQTFLFQDTFNRPNLFYSVKDKLNDEDPFQEIAVLAKIKYQGKSGIIYCTTKDQCEQVASILIIKYSINCNFFHAGVSEKLRKEMQDSWIKNET